MAQPLLSALKGFFLWDCRSPSQEKLNLNGIDLPFAPKIINAGKK
jgi:hypothetical protein